MFKKTSASNKEIEVAMQDNPHTPSTPLSLNHLHAHTNSATIQVSPKVANTLGMRPSGTGNHELENLPVILPDDEPQTPPCSCLIL